MLEPDSDEIRGEDRAEHEEIAMRKIDELDDAVDQGVTEGNQSIKKAVTKAEDCYLSELLWGFKEIDQDPSREN